MAALELSYFKQARKDILYQVSQNQYSFSVSGPNCVKINNWKDSAFQICGHARPTLLHTSSLNDAIKLKSYDMFKS